MLFSPLLSTVLPYQDIIKKTLLRHWIKLWTWLLPRFVETSVPNNYPCQENHTQMKYWHFRSWGHFSSHAFFHVTMNGLRKIGVTRDSWCKPFSSSSLYCLVSYKFICRYVFELLKITAKGCCMTALLLQNRQKHCVTDTNKNLETCSKVISGVKINYVWPKTLKWSDK